MIIPTGGGRQKILVVNNGGTIQKVPFAVGGGGGEKSGRPERYGGGGGEKSGGPEEHGRGDEGCAK